MFIENNPIQPLNFKSFIGQLFAKPSGDFICPVCSSKMQVKAILSGVFSSKRVCDKCGYKNG